MVIKCYPSGKVEIFENDILVGYGYTKGNAITNGYNEIVVENILQEYISNIGRAILPQKENESGSGIGERVNISNQRNDSN
jgi:hypothetical protein